MTLPTHHQSQAKHNEETARALQVAAPDWTVTMCFYAALHWVEWYARNHGADLHSSSSPYAHLPSPHERRRAYVRQVARQLNNKNLQKRYSFLEASSKIARYLETLSHTDAATYFQKTGATPALSALTQLKKDLGA